MLVIVGIIMLLLTISLPVVHGVQEKQTRLRCQTNVRNFAAACHHYAMNHPKQEYPAGSVSDTDDDYTQVSPAVLQDLGPYGVTPESATCQSIGKQDWLFSTDPAAPYIMGMIYWLGRQDIIDADDEVIYQSRARYDRRYDMSSTTVVTCMAYDAHTPETGTLLAEGQPASVMPHVANTYGEYTFSQPNPWLDGHPDGLAVGFLGGSAKFVAFEDLTDITQLHRIWYAPQ